MHAISAILCSASILASATAQSTNGFTIPTGLSDGTYEMSLAKDGTANVIRSTDEATNFTPITHTRLLRRDIPPSKQGCDSATYDHKHWQDALSKMRSYCNQKDTNSLGEIAGHAVRLWISGDAVVYVCVFTEKPQPCNVEEYNQCNKRIDKKCGDWKAGWSWIEKWNKTYGRARVGQTVCKLAGE